MFAFGTKVMLAGLNSCFSILLLTDREYMIWKDFNYQKYVKLI
ncbi:unnamed protein product [Schistosoma mattheei]|uniref:Uncharacterized protein n=1 Tax=Schistosoma mattheei TaxID=31246 RepID=A0A3P8CJU2_9TREM|nr:unnamed protein product [Schistosoma mattheei]